MCPSKASFLEGINDQKPAETSREVALRRASTPQKTIACDASLRRLCEASAFIAGVPIVCQIFARKAGVKGTCKGEERLLEGKAADINTHRSLLLH